ncbi:16S rRNA (guanine(966)-N(2))-methyltransferase RsmD [Aquifex pyrophilus]
MRPTQSIVKNAIFNILGDISGLRFLDLFAGTGQIGLEAERRGADVVFVEKNRKLAEEIKKKTKKGKVVVGDALSFLRRTKEKFHVIFADPPYAYDKYDELIRLALSRLEEGGVFILEHDKRKSFNAPEERRYGDTVLSIWVKE